MSDLIFQLSFYQYVLYEKWVMETKNLRILYTILPVDMSLYSSWFSRTV